MKRSEINNAIIYAKRMLDECCITLPMFGYWTFDEWKQRSSELDNIKKVMLGWDVTDYALGDFLKTGAVLFTIRNGSLTDPRAGTPYAEKLIMQRAEKEQEIPMHFHRMKTEDIINRGGGVLQIQLYNSLSDTELDEKNDVCVKMDGIERRFKAGSVIDVERGNSITLSPGVFHRFWAKKDAGDIVLGEVSSINDDTTDNVFSPEMDRFTSIEEDEPILHPLCNEYHLFDL